jgi:hypothetical protein
MQQQEEDYSVTYTAGPRLLFTADLTRRHLVALCRDLSLAFSEKKRTDDMYVFEPERITEGGLEMIGFPHKTGDQYKAIRFHLLAPDRTPVPWPWIESSLDVLSAWADEADARNSEVVVPARSTSETTLKAFYGAPVWDIVELGVLRQVLMQYGVRCKTMPSATSLISARGSCT